MQKQTIEEQWMAEALKLAHQAAQIGEVPIGAVVVCDGQIVGRGFNRREIDHNPLAHAEIIALQEASQTLGRWRLSGCTLYVTLEPCPMCAGALVNARVDRLVYAAKETKGRLNHEFETLSGILEAESAEILRSFFQKLRVCK
ncbi:MAG: nucleoside deaminase [Myxococcaceae bacterium]